MISVGAALIFLIGLITCNMEMKRKEKPIQDKGSYLQLGAYEDLCEDNGQEFQTP